MDKLEEKMPDALKKIADAYKNKIAYAEGLYAYTKDGSDPLGAYDEYKRLVREAEDFLDEKTAQYYNSNCYALFKDRNQHYNNIYNSSVVHRILSVLNSNPDGLPKEDALTLVKPDSIALGYTGRFSEQWHTAQYREHWIAKKRVEVSPNIAYRELRYVITDEGKKALDAFERFGHVPDVSYDKFIKTPSTFTDKDFEDVYKTSNS